MSPTLNPRVLILGANGRLGAAAVQAFAAAGLFLIFMAPAPRLRKHLHARRRAA